MVAVSKYEDAAQAFLKIHPVGTLVTPDRLVGWAAEHADGLKSDLLIDDADKRISALRRHLNDGGASRNLAEDQRFFLVMDDAKRKTMLVKSLADHVSQQADSAFGQSVRGAMSPLKRSQKAIDDIKLDEIEDQEKRTALEAQLQELVERSVPLSTLLSQQIVGHWVKKLEAKGYSEQDARTMVEMAPELSRMQKLLKLTT